jgi:hypothetical protein
MHALDCDVFRSSQMYQIMSSAESVFEFDSDPTSRKVIQDVGMLTSVAEANGALPGCVSSYFENLRVFRRLQVPLRHCKVEWSTNRGWSACQIWIVSQRDVVRNMCR